MGFSRTVQYFLLLSTCSLVSCIKIGRNEKPNIVLICADDLGWSDIGAYGSEISTPNIDFLAENGLRFNQFHNTAKCFPSRACLLTGVYAQDCGFSTTYSNSIQNAVTLGQVLKEAGYITLWSGKHHGIQNPVEIGFDRYYGLIDGACNYFNPGKRRTGELIPAQKNRKRYWGIDSLILQPYTPSAKDFYTTDYFTKAALQWLDECQENTPFFLYLAYNAPHDPLMAWPEDIKKYTGLYDTGYEAVRNSRFIKQKEIGIIDSNYELSSPTFDDWNSLSDSVQHFESSKMEVYAAMIDRMDQNIGLLLKKIKEIERFDNTIIIFTSDNGASAEVVDLDDDNDSAPVGSIDRWVSLGKNWANVSNTPLRFYKNYSYQGGISTPCIVWWPNKIRAGSFSSFPAHFIDFMPTFLDISGANYPDKGDRITPLRGESLLPVFTQNKTERDSVIYWEWAKGQAIRKGNWKLVKHGLESEWQLYNMQKDPSETQDKSRDHPEIFKDLQSLHEKWRGQH